MSSSARTKIHPKTRTGPDRLIRTLSNSGTIGVKVIVASELVAEGLSRRAIAATAGDALGRAMMGAVLIAVGSASDDADESNVESVQLQFRGNGPLGNLTAIADSRARVRGTVDHPELDRVRADGSPDIAGAIGLGPLNVVRHRPRWRSPYTGTVPLVSGEIAGDLTLYLTESEQTPSAMGLGVAFGPRLEDVGACGFLVQALPGATDDELAVIEENVQALPRLASMLEGPFDPGHLVDLLLAGQGSRDRYEMKPVFECPCSFDRAKRTLSLLERAELEEMIEAEESQEIICDFCGMDYHVPPDVMATLVSQMKP